MDRLNHVKIVTPDPEGVDRFLREVLDLPEGWPLRAPNQPSGDVSGDQIRERISALRGATGEGGYITGSPESRQFQLLEGEQPRIWAVAIGTRHLERAHERCVEQGIPCTDIDVTNWNDGAIRFFFAEVGGVLFEVLRVEDGSA